MLLSVLQLLLLCIPMLADRGSTPSSPIITTSLQGKLQFPNQMPFNATTVSAPAKIVVNNGEYITYSRMDGSFTIHNVPPGIHQIDIHSKEHHFGQIKIQLLEDSMDEPKCLEYFYPGAPKRVCKYPLVVHAIGTYEYFETKKGFSVFSLLKNPMVMMMLFSVGMMVVMPKMMEGLDPEEKARMKQQMEAQKDPTQMFSQMFGELTGASPAQLSDEAGTSGTTRRERRQQQRRLKS